MTNEEKARELAKKHHIIYDDYYDSMQECIESAMEMAKWKDEQMINEACRWLERNSGFYLYRELDEYDIQYYARIDKKKMIEDFRKSKEE